MRGARRKDSFEVFDAQQAVPIWCGGARDLWPAVKYKLLRRLHRNRTAQAPRERGLRYNAHTVAPD
jgi:hypothetical protein